MVQGSELEMHAEALEEMHAFITQSGIDLFVFEVACYHDVGEHSYIHTYILIYC